VPTLGIGSSRISEIDGMEMVYVPAGSFTMGSESIGARSYEGPEHEVYLDAYWIDKYEVMSEQYSQCVEANACDLPFRNSWDPDLNDPEFYNYPVNNVTHYFAKSYCSWVGRRLPTEAEWEKAARGTDGRSYPWGEQIVTDLANYGENYESFTQVGFFPLGASPYGVLDMAGNVREWVEDWFGEEYYKSSSFINPLGPTYGNSRVLRGGSYVDSIEDLKTYKRYYMRQLATFSFSLVGFRCAMDAKN